MDMTFEEFKDSIRDGIKSGILKISKPLSEFDMALLFAIGMIGERKGYPCEMTEDEIHTAIMTFADEAIYDKVNGWFFEQEEE